MIAPEIARMEEFPGIQEPDIVRAVADLAGASKGALFLRDNGVIVLNVAYDELDRRVQNLTGMAGTPRRLGSLGESDS